MDVPNDARWLPHTMISMIRSARNNGWSYYISRSLGWFVASEDVYESLLIRFTRDESSVVAIYDDHGFIRSFVNDSGERFSMGMNETVDFFRQS